MGKTKERANVQHPEKQSEEIEATIHSDSFDSDFPGPSVEFVKRFQSEIDVAKFWRDDKTDKLITFADAGRLVGVTRGAVWKWAQEDRFPVVRTPGGAPMVWKSDFVNSYVYAEMLHAWRREQEKI